MATAGDVTIAQDGGQGTVKLHPYVVALIRWCVSCLWSTATVFLHRLMTAPLPPIAGAKPSKPRPAGREHLHPEPRVECVVLHQPEHQHHNLDVIFVHGLYGSLGNTWRQGEWRSKYKMEPDRVHLRRPTSIPTSTSISTPTSIPTSTSIPTPTSIPTLSCVRCNITEKQTNENCCCSFNKDSNNECNVKNNNNSKKMNVFNNYAIDDKDAFTNIDEKFLKNIKKILPNDDIFITEKFYTNTLLDQVEIVDNYETQAKFVRDLFKNRSCDRSECDLKITNNNDENLFSNEENRYNNDNEANILYNNEQNNNDDNKCKCNNEGGVDTNEVYCKCEVDETKGCEVGCGCVCDGCYSPCWPRDWIKVDYPEARVISINYTSDPHLWRPLWIKENKRLRLHERAEQMTKQLLDLGVGQRPVIWVGHSKGGLFIKQIYCEAYEAYLKTNKFPPVPNQRKDEQNMTEFTKDNEMNKLNEHDDINDVTTENNAFITRNLNNNEESEESITKNVYNSIDKIEEDIDSEGNAFIAGNTNVNQENCSNNIDNETMNTNTLEEINRNTNSILNGRNDFENPTDLRVEDNTLRNENGTDQAKSSTNADPSSELRSRAGLWSSSAGFMFYSVPHRGSPLADFKTPITARSVELLEIAKDCSLVLTLQERWIRAAAPAQPLVRSLVETRRTLMSVLWLRIVSADSADPGIGALCGVSVDHREICKPTSRRCLLYTELATLIQAAISRCRCQ